MSTAEITLSVKRLMDLEASQYEQERGHGFGDGDEETAWRSDIVDTIEFKPGSTCLDVAAGTGVLTRLLAEWIGPDGHVVATDLSEAMLEENKNLLPSRLKDRVSFVAGDIHDEAVLSLAAPKSFDYITCRQAVGVFLDPIAIFRSWHKSLANEGRVVILDAMWTRRSWSGGWEALIDKHPLACAQSLATVSYCLSQAGFSIEKCSFLDRVNKWFEKTERGAFECPRYIVVAQK